MILTELEHSSYCFVLIIPGTQKCVDVGLGSEIPFYVR